MTKKRGKKCLTSAEAVPAKGQHTSPCSDCPWSREALNGWLGGSTIRQWLEAAHGEELIQCHTLKGAQCAGAAIYRANAGKRPRDPNVLRLPADREKVFAGPHAFAEHHSKVPPVEHPVTLVQGAEALVRLAQLDDESSFENLAQAVSEAAARIRCSPAEYRDGLRAIISTLEVDVSASEASER